MNRRHDTAAPAVPLEPVYFAVPDPDDADKMTFWRWTADTIASWPPDARYGPHLKPGDIPDGLDGAQLEAWLRRWALDVLGRWRRGIEFSLSADKDCHAALFSLLRGQCCCCSRKLAEATSKALAFCLECRAGWDERRHAAATDAITRARPLVRDDT